MAKRKATAPPEWYVDLWPEIDAALGANAYSALRTIAAAETDVSKWLASRGRRPAEPLRPADLRDAVREVGSVLSAPRFSTALVLLWLAKTNPEVGLGRPGEILVSSDRPLSATPPKRVRVRRRPATPAPSDPFEAVLEALARKLADVPLQIPPEIRALAWDEAASMKAWAEYDAMRKVKRGPAPKGRSAEAIAEKEARDARRVAAEPFRKERERERRRAEAAGLSTRRGKPGRPRKSGQ